MNIPPNTTEINAYAISKNGYPIYDFMIPYYPDNGHGQKLSGYVKASGIAFYTEDESVLKEYRNLKNKNLGENESSLSRLKEEIDFLNGLTKYLKKSYDIETMDSKAMMAFSHLSDEKSRKESFKKGYYGIAFLNDGNSLMIFPQNHPSLGSVFNEDLNDSEKFHQAQKKLLNAYQEKLIEPETKITNGAYQKLKKELKDFLTPHSSEHPLFEEIALLKAFKKDYATQMDIEIRADQVVLVQFKEINKTYQIRPNANKSKIELKEAEFKNWKAINFSDFLKTIYLDNNLIDKTISNFITGTKNKMALA